MPRLIAVDENAPILRETRSECAYQQQDASEVALAVVKVGLQVVLESWAMENGREDVDE